MCRTLVDQAVRADSGGLRLGLYDLITTGGPRGSHGKTKGPLARAFSQGNSILFTDELWARSCCRWSAARSAASFLPQY